VILLAEHAEPSLAAKKKQQRGTSSQPTFTPKNRVWNFENIPSGRPNIALDLSPENATGSVQFTYENASGRAEWISRDPLPDAEMSQGVNLYSYVGNNTVNYLDQFGLSWGGFFGGGLSGGLAGGFAAVGTFVAITVVLSLVVATAPISLGGLAVVAVAGAVIGAAAGANAGSQQCDFSSGAQAGIVPGAIGGAATGAAFAAAGIGGGPAGPAGPMFPNAGGYSGSYFKF